MKRILRIALVIVLIAVLIVAVVNIVRILARYAKADKTYTDLQDRFVMTVPPTEPPTEANKTDGTTPTEPEPPRETAPICVDFDALLEENEDVIGWLYCADTPINYPVVQGADNDEYLRSDLYGNYLFSGTLFADYRCGAVGEDVNHIIYGHSMEDDSMFGTLLKYRKQAYFDEHPKLYYLTPDGDFVIELYACAQVDRYSSIYAPNPSREPLANFLEVLARDSYFSSDVVLQAEDPLITLSTCSYDGVNSRLILIGRLTRL